MYAYGNVYKTTYKQYVWDVPVDAMCDVTKSRSLVMECLMTFVSYGYHINFQLVIDYLNDYWNKTSKTANLFIYVAYYTYPSTL